MIISGVEGATRRKREDETGVVIVDSEDDEDNRKPAANLLDFAADPDPEGLHADFDFDLDLSSDEDDNKDDNEDEDKDADQDEKEVQLLLTPQLTNKAMQGYGWKQHKTSCATDFSTTLSTDFERDCTISTRGCETIMASMMLLMSSRSEELINSPTTLGNMVEM
jgi:hypothetical protein